MAPTLGELRPDMAVGRIERARGGIAAYDIGLCAAQRKASRGRVCDHVRVVYVAVCPGGGGCVFSGKLCRLSRDV